MTARVHVYRATDQPAMRFRDVTGDVVRLRPRQLVRTDCCHHRRWAAHCTVQVYYDWIYRWCRDGKGCKA